MEKAKNINETSKFPDPMLAQTSKHQMERIHHKRGSPQNSKCKANQVNTIEKKIEICGLLNAANKNTKAGVVLETI